jgi:hypothetical protein
MARVIKPDSKHHHFRMIDKDYELLLVGRGTAAYLWAGLRRGHTSQYATRTFHGRNPLRRLAYAILRNVPAKR